MKYYQVDAFAPQPFGGNPAIVVPLARWLPDEILQNIAAEHNLSETAFFVKNGENYNLRWFTPNGEVRLCGHATLATAHVLFQHLSYENLKIHFSTLSGILSVSNIGQNLYEMTFPVDVPKNYVDHKARVIEALGIDSCVDIVQGKDDIIVVLEHEEQVKNLAPNYSKIKDIESRGIIVTSPCKDHDFISRCFYPKYNINEDPATGSAHTVLFPYWSDTLNKKILSAIQWSTRKGYFKGEVTDKQVIIYGQAYSILEGHYLIDF